VNKLCLASMRDKSTIKKIGQSLSMWATNSGSNEEGGPYDDYLAMRIEATLVLLHLFLTMLWANPTSKTKTGIFVDVIMIININKKYWFLRKSASLNVMTQSILTHTKAKRKKRNGCKCKHMQLGKDCVEGDFCKKYTCASQPLSYIRKVVTIKMAKLQQFAIDFTHN